MNGRFAASAAFFVLALLFAAAGRADTHTAPSWMAIDAPAKLVRLNIVSGFNANNGALNFNGYFAGDMQVVVPAGWTVEVAFKNQDAMLPHSLIVTKAFDKDHIPDLAGVNDVAIPRAYTNNPEEGIPSPKTDTVRFAAKTAGDYLFFCGAPGHGLGGMYTKFKIDPAAEAPYVIVEPGAEPGRS